MRIMHSAERSIIVRVNTYQEPKVAIFSVLKCEHLLRYLRYEKTIT